MDAWDGRLKQLQRVYSNICDAVQYQKHAPASEADVSEFEERLGQALPPSMRAVLTQFSANVFFEADFSKVVSEMPMSYELRRGVFRARFAFSKQGIWEAEKERKDLADNVFTQNSDADLFWQNKLGIMLVPGGDILALDWDSEEEEPPVVYLSYHERDSHGLVLGDNFADFIQRYLDIGAVGPEDTQLHLFLDAEGEKPGIQSEGENAWLFLGALGMQE